MVHPRICASAHRASADLRTAHLVTHAWGCTCGTRRQQGEETGSGWEVFVRIADCGRDGRWTEGWGLALGIGDRGPVTGGGRPGGGIGAWTWTWSGGMRRRARGTPWGT